MIRIYSFRDAKKETRERRIRAAVRAFLLEKEALPADCSDPAPSLEGWDLVKDKKGKPFFPGHPEVFVSITDSRDFWMIAFADHPVGIDLQKMQVHGSIERLAKRFFHLEETASILEPADEKERDERFFRVWAAKEAYVKFTGQGIDSAFSDFFVVSREESGGEIFHNPHLGVFFCFPEAYEGFSFCICVPLAVDLEKEAVSGDIIWEVTDW